MTLTHLGPGFANAIANLHNARRAGSAILNVIGDHMSWHLPADPPLASDIDALAGTVSAGVWHAQTASALTASTEGALAALSEPKARIHSVILPMDIQMVAMSAPVLARPQASTMPIFDAEAAARVAAAIAEGQKVLLLLGGDALREAALLHAARFAATPHVALMGETFPARAEQGGGLPRIARLSTLASVAHPYLSSFDCVAVIGTKLPVAFFGTEGYPSYLGRPECLVQVAGPEDDANGALRAIADLLTLDAATLSSPPPLELNALDAPLSPELAMEVVARYLPHDAIVSAEGSTFGFAFNAVEDRAARHSTIVLTGGAIGQGLPAAFGAAIAAPDRKVVAIQSDGSAVFTIQALWSMAREHADVTILIASNRRYNVLLRELKRNGYALDTQPVRNLLSLGDPDLNWLDLASGFGVPANRVTTGAALRAVFLMAMAERGPRLIEVVLP